MQLVFKQENKENSYTLKNVFYLQNFANVKLYTSADFLVVMIMTTVFDFMYSHNIDKFIIPVQKIIFLDLLHILHLLPLIEVDIAKLHYFT